MINRIRFVCRVLAPIGVLSAIALAAEAGQRWGGG
jgi:hypothetical protein